MKSIEEIVREQLGGAEQQPPAGTWDEIASRMSAPATAKHGIRSALTVAAIVAGVVLAAAVIYFAAKPSVVPTATPETAAIQTEELPDAVTRTESEERKTGNGKRRTENGERRTENGAQRAVSGEREMDAVYAESATPVISSVGTPIVAQQNTAVRETEQTIMPAETEQQRPASDPKTAATDSIAKAKVIIPQEDDEKPAAQNDMASVVIPNLLTPNGDGHNDCWVIPDLEQYGTVMVQIYTARSQMVYSSGNYRNDFCGGSLEDGNYFYVINFRERSFVRRGVLVIRRQ